MKKLILVIMLLLISVQGYATYTAQEYIDAKAYLGSGNKLLDPLYLFIADSTSASTVGKSFFYFSPTTAPATTEGYLYYSAALDALVLRTATGWETLEAGGDYASLDEAYNGGAGITVDAGALTLTAPNANDNVALAIVQSDTGTSKAFTLTNAGSGNTIDIEGQAGSLDIQGTGDLWSMSAAGALVCVGITTTDSINLANNEIIDNSTNDCFQFTTGDEDLKLDFTTGADIITLSSTSGVVSIDFGALDAFVGVASITGDAAADLAIGATNTGVANVTISQVGVGDNQVIIQSAGSAANAVELISSVAGITFTAASAINGTSAAGVIKFASTGGDITLDATNKSVILDGGEAVVDAITIVSAAGGLDVDTALSISLKSTEDTVDSIEIVSTAGGIDITAAGAATEDIDITNTAGSVNITAGENNVNAMILKVDGGTAETLQLLAIKGTGAAATTESDASIQLESTVGGIGLLSLLNGANAIRIEANGGTGETVVISSVKGTGTTLADSSIEIDSTVGGITIQANAAAKDVLVNSVLGSIYIEAEEDVANAILITADGGTASGVIILNDTGIGDESILLDSDAGGITINANAGSVDIEAVGIDDGDLKLDAGDDMTFTAAGDLTLAVTGTFNMGGALIANNRVTTVVDVDNVTLTAAQSGATVIMTMTGAAGTVTLPEATATEVGVWYILVDANITAGRDLSVDPEGDGTINGDAAGHTITCENDRDGEAVYIVCTAADTWYTVALGSSTVWTEE